jgi:hypothetical protein
MAGFEVSVNGRFWGSTKGALIGDVDRVAQQLEAEQPGIAVTRAQAVRVLLLEAIRARKATARR